MRSGERCRLYPSSSELLAEFEEIESGRKNDRPELTKALDLCRRRKATLVIAKLDRLARNVAFISALMESGAPFVATDMPEANKLTVHILAAVAEHEREAISARTKAALAVAKARGTKLGNPRPDLARATAASAERSARFRTDVLPLLQSIRAGGTSYRRIAATLNERQIPTLNGRSWHAATVRGALLVQ